MSFTAIVQKEMADLVREKRFGGWALTFLAFWAVFLVIYLESSSASQAFRRDYPISMLDLAFPMFFFLSISFVVLALFVLSDGITKERESGMLPLVGAKPIVRWHLVFAKLLSGLAVYVGAFLVTLLPMGVLAATLGMPAIVYLAQLFAMPFLALYVFMLGAGLLLGVAFQSSKAAIGTAAGLYLPLFLLIREGPMTMLYGAYPALGRAASYTPFDAAMTATQTLAMGGVMPWGPLFVTAGMGVALAAIAFWLFQRQEVAA